MSSLKSLSGILLTDLDKLGSHSHIPSPPLPPPRSLIPLLSSPSIHHLHCTVRSISVYRNPRQTPGILQLSAFSFACQVTRIGDAHSSPLSITLGHVLAMAIYARNEPHPSLDQNGVQIAIPKDAPLAWLKTNLWELACLSAESWTQHKLDNNNIFA